MKKAVKKSNKLDSLIKAVNGETRDVRYLIARNEVFFLRLLGKIAAGLTENNLLQAINETKNEMSFEDVKANVFTQLQYEGKV